MAPGPRVYRPGCPGVRKVEGGPGPGSIRQPGPHSVTRSTFRPFFVPADRPGAPGPGPGAWHGLAARGLGPGSGPGAPGPGPEAEGPSAARPAARDQLGPGPARNQTGAFTRQLSEDAVQADVEGSWTKAQNSVFRIAKFTAHFNNLAIRSQNSWLTIS